MESYRAARLVPRAWAEFVKISEGCALAAKVVAPWTAPAVAADGTQQTTEAGVAADVRSQLWQPAAAKQACLAARCRRSRQHATAH